MLYRNIQLAHIFNTRARLHLEYCAAKAHGRAANHAPTTSRRVYGTTNAHACRLCATGRSRNCRSQIRVMSRLRALAGDPTKLGAAHTALAGQGLDPVRPGDFNQVGPIMTADD